MNLFKQFTQAFLAIFMPKLAKRVETVQSYKRCAKWQARAFKKKER